FLLVIGCLFLFFSQSPQPKKGEKMAKEEKIRYKPLLIKEKREGKQKAESREQRKAKEEKEETKTVESIEDLELDKISPKEKEQIQQEMKEINKEFKKKPNLKEIEELKGKGVVIY
ncbi:MAG: hypothetical protein KKB76_02030, partial [Candidatus Omnitrophica bacterium]|nr:hypothetical protein [Candidatus Omnitrophota bacterium]